MIEAGKILQKRYRIDKQIGEGGMGAVYVATDERFGSIVAIKQTLCMDDSYRKAIEREARLLNSLKHPALPRVSDHFVEENGQFLVMEYIPGEDLYEIMESSREPFDVEQVLDWADQLLDALEFLHNQENPVIHRDIKPQNLKAVHGGKITLLDFGLAKGNPSDSNNKTAAKSIFGYSRNYASLEQIQGTGTDPRSDLYSLAATLYHLLTNTPPEDALTRAMAVLNKRPDPLKPANYLVEGIPAGVAGVLHNAMDLNSGLRPKSAAEMRQMLREYEKYENFAQIGPFEHRPIDPAIFAQETKLMPVVTHGPAGHDVLTRLHSDASSEVTSVRRTRNTSPKAKRRSVLASISLSLVIIGAAAAGGLYLYEESLIEYENGSQDVDQLAVVPPPVEPVAPQQDVAAANAPASQVETPKPQPAVPSRNRTTGKQTRPAPERRVTVRDGSEEIRIEGDTVFIGDMKMTELGIETPTIVFGEHGITPKTSKVKPVPPAPGSPELKGFTPEQYKKFMILRNSANRPAPKPTPGSE